MNSQWTYVLPSNVDVEFSCLSQILFHDCESSNIRRDLNSHQFNDWLLKSLSSYVKDSSSNALTVEQLMAEIRLLYQSNMSLDELQLKLFDLLGETGIELISALLARVIELKEPFQSNDARMTLISNDSFDYNMESEKRNYNKIETRDQRKGNALQNDFLSEIGFNEEYLAQERMLGLQGGALNSYATHAQNDSWLKNFRREKHEFVGLPSGTTRKISPGTEEVFIPAPPRPTPAPTSTLVDIGCLEPWAQAVFTGTEKFNRIQSAVFNTAYNSSENMLVCAPTGAG